MTEAELWERNEKRQEQEKKESASWFYAASEAPKKLFVYTWIHPWSHQETCTCIIRANDREEADILFSAAEPDIEKPDVQERSCVGDSAVIFNN